jgi:hypothetical protein
VGRYRSSIALAGGGLLISVFLIAKGPKLGDKGAAPLRAIAGDLDSKQRELAAAVEARATTLAQLPRLAWAVATDEETVRDLTPDELGFRTQPGELIALTQIDKKTSKAGTLLRVPPTASLRAPLTELGPRFLVSGGDLLVASVVGIEPRERADAVRGALVVARRLDLADASDRLIRAGIAAHILAPDGSVVTLTEVPALARQPEVTVPIGSPARLQLVARLPAQNTGLWVALAVFVLVIWGGAAVLAARRVAMRAGSAAAAGDPTLQAIGRATNGAFSSDKTPVLDLLMAERNITASSNGHHQSNGAAVGPIVEIVSGPVSVGVPHSEPIPASTADFRSLFREFMDLRRRCGDKSKAPTYEEFFNSLHQRRSEMLDAHSASEVLFQIVFIDGRAVVRAKGVS